MPLGQTPGVPFRPLERRRREVLESPVRHGRHCGMRRQLPESFFLKSRPDAEEDKRILQGQLSNDSSCGNTEGHLGWSGGTDARSRARRSGQALQDQLQS